jgi:hypothetical protein
MTMLKECVWRGGVGGLVVAKVNALLLSPTPSEHQYMQMQINMCIDEGPKGHVPRCLVHGLITGG